MFTGKISCKELKAVLNSLGEKMSEKEFVALIREADMDGDGSISFDGAFNWDFTVTFYLLKCNSIQQHYCSGHFILQKQVSNNVSTKFGFHWRLLFKCWWCVYMRVYCNAFIWGYTVRTFIRCHSQTNQFKFERVLCWPVIKPESVFIFQLYVHGLHFLANTFKHTTNIA